MGRTPNALNNGSVQSRVSLMIVGDVIYVETSADKYINVMHAWNIPKSRRTPATQDFVMECSLWQAVAAYRDWREDAPCTH